MFAVAAPAWGAPLRISPASLGNLGRLTAARGGVTETPVGPVHQPAVCGNARRPHVCGESGRPGEHLYSNLPVGQTDCPAPGSRLAGPLAQCLPRAEEPILLAVIHSPAAVSPLMRYGRGFRTAVVPDIDQAQRAARQLMPQAAIEDRACEELDSERLEALVRKWHSSSIRIHSA